MSFEYDYAIITIDDRRKDYKYNLRKYLTMRNEVFVECVDGRNVDAAAMLEDKGMKFAGWTPTAGEFGIWMSAFNHWEYAGQSDKPLVVFEDDAMILDNFDARLQHLAEQLPSGWDFVSLWVPENQREDYMYSCTYNIHGYRQINGRVSKESGSSFNIGKPTLARVYQGYGMVAMMYSPQGGRRLTHLARLTGMYTPVDCFIYDRANATVFGNGQRELDGYAPKPISVFVFYEWPETTVHNTQPVIL